MKALRSFAFASVLAAFAPLAHAVQITTSASLSGPAENPPAASPGTGNVVVTLDTTAHLLRVTVAFSGLTSGTTAAHIHCCIDAPGNVGVASTTPYFAGFPLGVTSGTMDQTYDTTQPGTWNAAFITGNGGTPLGAEAALAVALQGGRAYFNVHTTGFPGGEIRGFLAAQAPPGVGSIPTLSEWSLVVLAVLLAVTAWLVLRRRMP